jgi:hypothetical protein
MKKLSSPALRRCLSVAALTLAGASGVLALAPAGQAGASTVASPAHAAAAATKYSFTTLDNAADPTFNQLLGISNKDVICGYFGSGAAGHPNKGYILKAPYGQANYVNENFPGSVQTQVTGLNGFGDTTGFWIGANGVNHGFVEWNDVFASYNDPHTPKIKDAVNQLLGINDSGIAVGFYNDAKGNSHAYELNQATGVFTALTIPDAVSTVATGINNNGYIVGTFSDAAGDTSSWLLTPRHQLTTYQFPAGSDTQALGIGGQNQIVGSYLDAAGVMHGFVLTDPLGPVSHWQRIDDPHGVGSTVVNGVNYAGDLVGFYTDAAGNTDGMLATPTS